MLDLAKPVKRKMQIKGRDWMLSFNNLGIVFREKGSREAGVLLEWSKALMTAHGFNPANPVKCSKTGKLTTKRGAV